MAALFEAIQEKRYITVDNLSKQVAEYYQQLAIDLNAGKAGYFEKRDELIRTYKEQGRRAENQAALKAMEKERQAKEPTIPADLCYLYGTYLEDYLHDVEICQRFAKRRRERMAEIFLERTGMTAVSAFHTVHNYIDTDEMILRKGAIAAHKDELVLIPINMKDGSVKDAECKAYYISKKNDCVPKEIHKITSTDWSLLKKENIDSLYEILDGLNLTEADIEALTRRTESAL